MKVKKPSRLIRGFAVLPIDLQISLCIRPSPHPLQLVDHPRDHAQSLVPEGRVARVEAEGREELLVVLCLIFAVIGCNYFSPVLSYAP